MTIEDLYQKYNVAQKRHSDEYDLWRTNQLFLARGGKNNLPNEPFNGFHVDYNLFGVELVQALKEEFNLNDEQASYIYSIAYEQHHAYFGGIFYGAQEIAEKILKFPWT